MRSMIVALLLLATPALADDKPAARNMIDTSVVLTDLHGKPMKDVTQRARDDTDCAKCPDLTLAGAIAGALIAEHADEQPSAILKARRFALAARITDAKSYAFTAGQIAEIVRLMNVWDPKVAGRALPLLDANLDLSDKSWEQPR